MAQAVGRIDTAAATRSLLVDLDAIPFDVVLLRDSAGYNRGSHNDPGCTVALEVSEGGNKTVGRPVLCGPDLGNWLDLHPALAEFLTLVAKERRRLVGPMKTNAEDELDCDEIQRKGRKRVLVSIISTTGVEDDFGSLLGQSNKAPRTDTPSFIDDVTFTAEKVDVSCVPDEKQLLLSLIFVHCDDPSLNEKILRLCECEVNRDFASIDWNACQDPDDGFHGERLINFLQESLDGKVVVEGGLLAVALAPLYNMDIDDGENMIFLKVGTMYMQNKVNQGEDRAMTHIPELSCRTPSNHEAAQKGAVFRLGSEDQFAIVALDCFSYAGTNEGSTVVPIASSSSYSSTFPKDLPEGCPGYELLLEELVAIASIDDRRAAPSAVLLTGCAGVGKSRLARHLIKALSTANQQNSLITKVLSAKEILLAAASSSLEDLKAFILKIPENDQARDNQNSCADTTDFFQRTRSLLIIDDLDVFIDADNSGEEPGMIRDSERLVSIHAIGCAIDDLIRIGCFGSGYRTQSSIHAPFIMGICGASPAQLPAEIMRVGRMEKVVFMPPPTQSQREQMLRYLFSDMCISCFEDHSDSERKVSSPVDVARRWAAACAPVTSGCVAADLQRICVDAAIKASSNNSHGTAPGHGKDSFSRLEDCNNGVASKGPGLAVVSWDDVREATRSCIPSQLAQLEVSMGDTPMQEQFVPGHQVDYRKLHELLWQTFGGYDDVKARLYRTVVGPWRRHASRPQRSLLSSVSRNDTSLQIAPPSGVLFHGGPGVGKTLAAHCLASSLGLPVVKVRASDVLDQWLGGSEAAIRSLFERARAASPSILFFDEIDALAINREDEDGSTDVHSRVLSTLLNEIDGVSSDSEKRDVLVIAATNRLKDIDAALLRPGRLEEHVLLRSPRAEDISAIFGIHLSSVPLGANVSIEELSESLAKEGASGADVEGICNEACMSAIHKLSETENPEDVHVLARDFEKAIQQWKT